MSITWVVFLYLFIGFPVSLYFYGSTLKRYSRDESENRDRLIIAIGSFVWPVFVVIAWAALLYFLFAEGKDWLMKRVSATAERAA